MKNKYLHFYVAIFGSLFISFVVTISAMAYPSGSPAGYTGSPGDGQNCVSCHGGSAATVAGWITSNIPASGYTAGSVYTLTATVSGSGKKGFEVSPQNASGTQLGILAAGTNSHLIGGTKYVTQNSSGSTSSTVIYVFTWTAPPAGAGTVTFYGAFTVGKSTTKLSTLVVDENPAVPLSATATATPPLICAGQSAQLNVIPVGGSGAYTYSWNSIPAGFTSSLANPVVTPSGDTQYFVHVSDGLGSVNATTNVAVDQPATATAGNDTTCAFLTTQIPLVGAATNYAGVLWTTSGNGTFSDAGALAGNYFPSTTDKAGGNITLTLTASAQTPCATAAIDTRIIQFDGPIGMEENPDGKINMTIMPNPSRGIFKIALNGFGNQEAMITVSEITGKVIIQRNILVSVIGQEQFNLSGYSKGIYLVKIQTAAKSMVRKLIIE